MVYIKSKDFVLSHRAAWMHLFSNHNHKLGLVEIHD